MFSEVLKPVNLHIKNLVMKMISYFQTLSKSETFNGYILRLYMRLLACRIFSLYCCQNKAHILKKKSAQKLLYTVVNIHTVM